MNKRFHLPLALLAAGLTATVIHDYAYRRVDSGEGDYELWGMVTHAGTDMLFVTGILFLIAVFWTGERR